MISVSIVEVNLQKRSIVMKEIPSVSTHFRNHSHNTSKSHEPSVDTSKSDVEPVGILVFSLLLVVTMCTIPGLRIGNVYMLVATEPRSLACKPKLRVDTVTTPISISHVVLYIVIGQQFVTPFDHS